MEAGRPHYCQEHSRVWKVRLVRWEWSMDKQGPPDCTGMQKEDSPKVVLGISEMVEQSAGAELTILKHS